MPGTAGGFRFRTPPTENNAGRFLHEAYSISPSPADTVYAVEVQACPRVPDSGSL
jgi:hypothetical protein